MNKSFDPILDAMLRCGFVHNNVCLSKLSSGVLDKRMPTLYNH